MDTEGVEELKVNGIENIYNKIKAENFLKL
jgi:hypothetical protein